MYIQTDMIDWSYMSSVAEATEDIFFMKQCGLLYLVSWAIFPNLSGEQRISLTADSSHLVKC